MVGRDKELELLYDHLGKAISGHGGLVLISGEAGIGKTRILAKLSETAAKSGFLRIGGECIPGIPLPYLPFQEAFSAFTIGPFSSINSSDSSGQKQPTSVLMDSFELLTNESAKRPILICLEDLHWADSASIQLLHFLARNVKKLRVLIVGTYRPEDLLPSESGEAHPLQSSIRLMTREGTLTEVTLGRIGQEEISEAVEGMMESPTDPEFKRRIFEHSGGNPLFAVETLRMLVSEGRLVQNDGIWVMAGDGDLSIPRTIQEVILRRLDKLSNEERHIIECASVIGETFDPSLIAETIGGDELHLLDELDIILKSYQLVAGGEDSYSFTHAKIRDVTYDSISKPKRTGLHRRVGCSLEKRLPDDALWGALSWHFNQGHDKEKCAKYSILAGKYCYAKKAMREAKSYYLLVLAKTEGDPNLAAERVEALEGLGDLRLHLSSPGEWYSYYEQFLNLNHDKKARARVLAKAAECWDQMSLADTKKANELLDEAELLSEGDPRNLAVIEVNRGYLKINDGKNNEALAHFGKAKDHFEKVGDSIGSIQCRNFMAASLEHDYRFTEAIAIVEELLPMAIKSGDPELTIEVELASAELYGYVGQTELAKKYSSKVIQESEKMGSSWHWREGLFYRAMVLELEGNLETAKDTWSKAFESAKMNEVSYHITGYEIALSRCELDLGLVDSAEYHYEEVANRMSTLDPNNAIWAVQSIYLSVLKAGLLAAKGKNQQSDEVFAKAIEECEAMHYWYELVNCRSRYGMSLAQRGMNGQAREQFDEAMNVAKRIGCEKRVQLWAKRVGISL